MKKLVGNKIKTNMKNRKNKAKTWKKFISDAEKARITDKKKERIWIKKLKKFFKKLK